MSKIMYIVVPCFNEEEVLLDTNSKLITKIKELIDNKLISEVSRVLYVDDGSRDSTWDIICELHEKHEYVTGLKLSRNKGHQNALMAGLMEAKNHADMVVSMDADLQDDIDVLERFIQEYENGADIVYGVRNSRKKDSFFKRNTAIAFYKLMRMMGVELVYNHADYRLMSKRALHELEGYKEVNLFLRGIIPLIGFKTATVEYERGERLAGETKYPLRKMLQFAIEGITSCSVRPIRLIAVTGMLIALMSVVMLIHTIVGYFQGGTIDGWASMVVIMCFLGGFQIFSIGIVGEYVGKIYLEAKGRPRYAIESKKIK
ncbi:MAG: glycosyltransferase family 2 protein [Lachnospiraceae bacterium]|nr:glycosyltransferase family 2 protein [Lachnospiraceae bacterium]